MVGPKIVILYGSQTGNAEEVAERVTREALTYNLKPYLSSMDEADFADGLHWTKDSIMCFVCSTTGQGNEPDNMKNFWRYLRMKSLKGDFFGGARFGVLGLGDSSYSHYNVVAKKLYKRVEQLGGIPIVELGLADEQHELGSDAFIDPWVINFWKKVLPNFENLPSAIEVAPLQPKFTLVKEKLKELAPSKSKQPHPVKTRILKEKERVTDSTHFQDVQLISIELGIGQTYEPGDVLMIQPNNLDKSIEHFFRIFPNLHKNRDEKYFIVSNPKRPWAKIPAQIEQLHPQPWSMYDIVKYYFDIQAVPKRYFFELLSYFTSSDLEREGLLDLASPQGQENLYRYCNRPKRNVLEVLQDFPNTTGNIPEDYLFDLIGPIKPRAFSIASSMEAHPDIVQILMAVVNYRTTLKESRLGLCSNWLSQMKMYTQVPVWIEKGSYKFPSKDKENPVIMVGPGTGCAPFRSLISSRLGDLLGKQKLVLFFGCRFETKDFYFKHDWSFYEAETGLKMFTAFSRDNPDSGRIYVQHRIEEQAELIGDLIVRHSAFIFVAGNAKQMPIAVAEAFKCAVEKVGEKNPEAFMKELAKSGRYQTEVWS